ncbi:cytidine deaminase-like protein [Geopyxis carbonaria]|nr:cytidine deaminase-like protein [Geopyxis carbonaria]
MKFRLPAAVHRLCARLSVSLRRRRKTKTKPTETPHDPPPSTSDHSEDPTGKMMSDMISPNNKEYHANMMGEALAEAEAALAIEEVPVGCVFVYRGQIIGRGKNDTNRSLCGTRHAEFIAMEHILRTYPPGVFEETDLYVTVEPCIMCASALRQVKIRRVFFGAMNDRFGGCGGVMRIHEDSAMVRSYKAIGGIRYDEAIMLLRRFYVQENGRAPKPIEKRSRHLKLEIAPFGEGSGAMAVQSAFAKSGVFAKRQAVSSA